MILWIIGGIIAVIAIIVILIYNGLVTSRNRCNNAWAQIDVQLKKRADLVPNLVNTVKGYMKHEKSVFTEVTKARSAIMKAGDVKSKERANNMLTGALKSLFAVAEDYPKLQASENFKLLQEQLEGIENKIAYSRQFYNDSVLTYNTKLQVFPNNIFANAFGFNERDYFEVENKKAREAVNVKF